MTQVDDAFNEGQRIIERVMRRLQLRMYTNLTLATPVDTGFVRSRWEVSTRGGAAVEPAIRPRDRVVAQSNAAAVFAKNQQIARQLAAGYRIANGRIIRLTNGTFYLVFLNAGSSAQAGSRFIERAINTAVQTTARELG